MRSDPHRAEERRGKRLLWFVLLYVASLAIFAGLVYGLRGVVAEVYR
ncbi:Tfp pilus assembly protein PilN [Microvirga lupini]|uniref:Tfp pilus assembly protein PilN n=1 Tax=Microvirga lupini TaxID=420324 RepID=A0A7W4VIJ0_9HYPH|nr:hypothetical protein [Microvirga lupini]MBB3017192.1 Tfp pilus assembly protein PilN [Microvirga lupini]